MTKKIKVANEKQPDEAPGVKNAQLALLPSVNAAAVMEQYQGNVVGKDVDLMTLIDGLRESFDKSKDGDLSRLEYMLIGQATALQSIFTSLARRAQSQQYQKNLESFLGLALKAQAQSRATIQAVVELKFPRQVAFVKQANISHGPQQINNGPRSETNMRTHPQPRQKVENNQNKSNETTHAEENIFRQNKLLEDQSHERTHLDTGATTATSRINPALETVGAVNRAKKCGR